MTLKISLKLSQPKPTEAARAVEPQAAVSTASPTTAKSPLHQKLAGLMQILQRQDANGLFAQPVDQLTVPDYFDVIKQPMDLKTMNEKLPLYASEGEFFEDFYLICRNAMAYNAPTTVYYLEAEKMLKFAMRLFVERNDSQHHFVQHAHKRLKYADGIGPLFEYEQPIDRDEAAKRMLQFGDARGEAYCESLLRFAEGCGPIVQAKAQSIISRLQSQ